jgi:hypothetical protein
LMLTIRWTPGGNILLKSHDIWLLVNSDSLRRFLFTFKSWRPSTRISSWRLFSLVICSQAVLKNWTNWTMSLFFTLI